MSEHGTICVSQSIQYGLAFFCFMVFCVGIIVGRKLYE